jgi:hypothetical protein
MGANHVVILDDPPPVTPPDSDAPPAPFLSWCDWARAGLRDALEGMRKTAGGVTEYHIGTRGLHRSGPADQIKNVDYWNEMVKLYCGIAPLPTELTGRDAVCRIIPRDV